MPQPDITALARLEAATDRLLGSFPDGVSLIEVGACLSVAALALRAAAEKNPYPMPPEVAEPCDLIEEVLVNIARVRPDKADVRH